MVDWGKSIKNKVAVDRHNYEMVLGALMAGAVIGASSSANSGSVNATKNYALVMGGATITGTVNELTTKVSDLERTQIFPENHLYSPFSVPPGLVSKRWILIQYKPGIQINNFSFDIYYKDGKKTTYNVAI